jgi:hypothetical protein
VRSFSRIILVREAFKIDVSEIIIIATTPYEFIRIQRSQGFE